MRKLLLLLVPLAGVGVAAVYIGRGAGPGEAVVDGPPPERYQVRLSSASRTIDAEGELLPAESAAIAPPFAGRVDEVLVDVGTEVRAGQALMRLDDEELRIELAAAEAVLEVAGGELRAAREALDDVLGDATPEEIEEAGSRVEASKDALWRLLEERDARCAAGDSESAPVADCAEAEAAVRRGEVDVRLAERSLALLADGPSESDVASAREAADLAQARLTLAEAEVERARLRLEQATIEAPIDGTVTALTAEPGAFVDPGSTVAQVADLKRLQVDLPIGERDIAMIEPDQSVHVKVAALPFHRIGGRIRSIAPTAHELAGATVYSVVVDVEATKAPLRPGMSADVTVITSFEKPRIMIPLRAVLTGGVPTVASGTGVFGGQGPGSAEASAGEGYRTTVEIIARNALPRAARGATAFAGSSMFGGFGPGAFGDFDAATDTDSALDTDTDVDDGVDADTRGHDGADARAKPGASPTVGGTGSGAPGTPAAGWPWGGPDGGTWDWRTAFATLPTLDELGSQLDGLPTRLVEVRLGPIEGEFVTVIEGLWHGDIIVMPPDDGAAGGP